MARELLVFGKKTFKITVPDGSKVTFGPWSPPGKGERAFNDQRALTGTLRVYSGATTTSDCIAVFSDVTGFRDLSLDYQEQVVVEQGATIWKSDKEGYKREESVKRSAKWTDGELPALGDGEEGDDEPA